MNNIILLLGSNLGNPSENIKQALKKISEEIGEIKAKSNLAETFPVEFESSLLFSNMAVLICSKFSPTEIILKIKAIENNLGRVFDSSFYGEYKDRLIDIDIVYFNRLKFVSKRLTIPHQKNAYERDFSVALINELDEFIIPKI